MSIRLSKEHGVNPTMVVCFFCGKETGEIALLGTAYKGKAPKYMWLGSYESCKACKEHMNKGLTVFESLDTPTHNKQPAIKNGDKDTYPTGRWLVMNKDEAPKIFTGVDTTKHDKVFCDKKVMDYLIARVSEEWEIPREQEE